jgi:DNA-binding MarR family transcriptional regulator
MRLYKHGPKTLTELSELHGVSPPSMSKSVNRLTSAGYALRGRDPKDKRKVLFSATPEGEKFAGAARAQRNAWLNDQLNVLSQRELAAIERAIVSLNRIADL